MQLIRNKLKTKFMISLATLFVAFGICIVIGPTTFSSSSFDNFEAFSNVLFKIRIPRSLLAIVVGGSLAISGHLLQSILKNPLADPFTLGISSGASIGACLAIVLGLSGVTLWAFAGALMVGLLVIIITQKIDPSFKTETIVLIGIVTSLFISSVVAMILVLFEKQSVQILMFLNGTLASANYMNVSIIFIVNICVMIYLLKIHKQLDILSFGENEAYNLGINTKILKIKLIIVSSLLTAFAVSTAGIIGFVGIIVPHLSRKLFGARHQISIITTYIYGGIFLMIADLLARIILIPLELPVGAVTSLFGAPFFIYTFFKGRN